MPQFLGNPMFDILLMVVISTLPVLIILGIVFGAISMAERRTQRLLAEGERAEATVLDVRYTGVRINRRPQILVELEVQRLAHPPYKAGAKMLISRSSSLFAPSNVYPPGTRLDVRVDPNHPDRVAIAGPIGVSTTSAAQVFAVDGQTYQYSDLPPEAQQAFQQMSNMFAQNMADSRGDSVSRLLELKQMLDQGLITETEYEAKKAEILERL